MGKFARLFHGAREAGMPCWCRATILELTERLPKDPCLQYTFLWADSFMALNLNALKPKKFGNCGLCRLPSESLPRFLFLANVKIRYTQRLFLGFL